MKKRLILATSLSLALLLSGCGTGTKTMEVDQSRAVKSEATLLETSKDNINFKIKVNQQEFDLNDEIIIHAAATNNGTKNFAYLSGSSSCPSPVSIKVVSQETGNQLVTKPTNENGPCTDDINISELAPNDRVSKVEVFLPKELFETSVIPAFGGTYDVIISMQPADDNWSEWSPSIEVKTTIAIKGNERSMIDKESAINIANSHEEVKNWIENHSGESISKVENDEYYILFYDGWQKTGKEEFERLKEGIYQKERQVRLQNDKWSIEYLSKLGTAPHRIKILLDATNGEIISIETFEK